jgi:hypothetical protein
VQHHGQGTLSLLLHINSACEVGWRGSPQSGQRGWINFTCDWIRDGVKTWAPQEPPTFSWISGLLRISSGCTNERVLNKWWHRCSISPCPRRFVCVLFVLRTWKEVAAHNVCFFIKATENTIVLMADYPGVRIRNLHCSYEFSISNLQQSLHNFLMPYVVDIRMSTK